MLSEYEQNLSKVVSDNIVMNQKNIISYQNIINILIDQRLQKIIFRRPRVHTWDGGGEGEAEMKFSEILS